MKKNTKNLFSVIFVGIFFLASAFVLKDRFSSPEIQKVRALPQGDLSRSDDIKVSNFPRDIKKSVLSDDGDRILFLTNEGVLLWEEGVEQLKEIYKGTEAKAIALSGDGLNYAFLVNENDTLKLFVGEDGFPIEQIEVGNLNHAWNLEFNRFGDRLLLTPANPADREATKLLLAPKLLKFSLRSNSNLNNRETSHFRNVEIVELKTTDNQENYSLGSGHVFRLNKRESKVEKYKVATKSNYFDFDGDGAADLISFASGSEIPVWRIMTTSGREGFTKAVSGRKGEMFTYRVGDNRGIPILGDFDGDGIIDFATFTPGFYGDVTDSNPNWQIYFSNSRARLGNRFSENKNQYLSIGWCVYNMVAMPADYDGDGQTDIACYEASTKKWTILFSSRGFNEGQASLKRKKASIDVQWGEVGAIPFTIDINGDGKSEIGYWLKQDGKLLWKIKTVSSNSRESVFEFGEAKDVPLVGDANGDGFDDAIVLNKKKGQWQFRFSGSNGKKIRTINWFLKAEPIFADFDGDGIDDPGFFIATKETTEPRWQFISSRIIGTEKDIKKIPSWTMMGRYTWGNDRELPQQVILRNHQRSVSY
jgi:hypothetical protein